MKVAVVGLGYVGLPLAAAFALAGDRVVGIDVDEEKVHAVNAGRSPLTGREPDVSRLIRRFGGKRIKATTDYGMCAGAASVFVAVETPINEDSHAPNYKALRSALRSLAPNLRKGALVSIESTLAPGTMGRTVKTMLEKGSGMRVPGGFQLVHSPERLTAGRLMQNLTTLDRIVGAEDNRSAQKAKRLYSRVTRADIHTTNWLTAEIVKTAENTYRDVQLGLANELALISEDYGVDVFEVRDLLNTCPGRDLPYPGAGVGGACIPKDPWLLVSGVSSLKPLLIPAAREVNEFMPHRMVTLTAAALRDAGRKLPGARIAVLGFAYKAGTDDARNSPAIPLIRALRRRGAEVRIHDPYARSQRGFRILRRLGEALDGADAAILVTAHPMYERADWHSLGGRMRRTVFVDGRRLWDTPPKGWVYRAIGRGQY